MEWELLIQEPYFSLVLEGKKTAEGRTPKPERPYADYGKITIEDILKFVLLDNKDKWFKTKIKYIYHYKTPEEMLKAEGLENMLPGIKTIKEGAAIYRSFPGYMERIEKYGMYAFGIGEILEKSVNL